MCLQYKSFENTVGKGEIAYNEKDQSGGAHDEYARYFDKGTSTAACAGKICFFFFQDRIGSGLMDENVFINLKCSFLFDFLSKVLTHNCVIHENGKTDESQKFNEKRVTCPFNPLLDDKF